MNLDNPWSKKINIPAGATTVIGQFMGRKDLKERGTLKASAAAILTETHNNARQKRKIAA